MCAILKFTYIQGNSYTSKCLKISSSTAQVRDQCMDIVSNSRIQEGEYTRWKMGRKDAKAPTLTVSECNARRVRMNKIVQGHKVGWLGWVMYHVAVCMYTVYTAFRGGAGQSRDQASGRVLLWGVTLVGWCG